MVSPHKSKLDSLTEEERAQHRRLRHEIAEAIHEIEMIHSELRDVNHELEALDYVCEGERPRWKLLSTGRLKFSESPSEGVLYFVDQRLVCPSADAVAEFLYTTPGLSKSALGIYLGEPGAFNRAVLEQYVRAHHFHNMPFLPALRHFLWGFRLPGEAQKIDRMMEAFANHYCDQNPGKFHPDTCYMLSFSTIMLNTSLHNPSCKEKPSLERFIHMNRGIDQGGDVDASVLKEIYDDIRADAFSFPDDDDDVSPDLDVTFSNPVKKGFLAKHSGSSLASTRMKTTWKRRYFILTQQILYYFDDEKDKEPRGIIPLENVGVRHAPCMGREHVFELYSNNDDVIKASKTAQAKHGTRSVYRLAADSQLEAERWVEALRVCVATDPFYEMISFRKSLIRKNKRSKSLGKLRSLPATPKTPKRSSASRLM